MIETNKLTANELAHFVGCDCYYNNGREVLLGKITFLILHNYMTGKCKGIIPMLRCMDSMTEEEKLHFDTVSDSEMCEELLWLTQNGFDVFYWLDKKKVLNKADGVFEKKYSIKDFGAMLETKWGAGLESNDEVKEDAFTRDNFVNGEPFYFIEKVFPVNYDKDNDSLCNDEAQWIMDVVRVTTNWFVAREGNVEKTILFENCKKIKG